MMITCSNCQSKIRVPDSAAGKKGKCPKCGNAITIPAAGEGPAGEAAPEPAPEQPAGSPFDFSEEPISTPKRGKAKAADNEVEQEAVDEEGGRKGKKPESIGLSLTSLILGGVSLLTGCGGYLCCCVGPVSLLCAIGALITGFLGMKKGGAVMAYIGMGLGGFSLLVAIGSVVFAFVGTGFAQIMQMVGR